MSQTLPAWAVQRIATALETQRRLGQPSVNPSDLARRTGLSKSLTRRCLHQLRQDQGRRAAAQHSHGHPPRAPQAVLGCPDVGPAPDIRHSGT